MTHSLPLLCLAVISYLFPSHNATAQSLSELNPAPVELNSSLVSADTYQVAGIYHIVDYSKKMESFFGKRVNETDQDVDSRTCEQYGFVGNCTAPAVGKGIKHPIPGLTCYEKCVSCAASGYVDSCLSPKTGTQVTTADGLNCYKNCQCPAKYKYTAYTPNSMIDGFVRIRCPLPAVVAGETCQTTPPLSITATGIVSLYTQCNCPSEYNLTSKLNNADCEACTIGSTTKYKCVANCSAYPLTVCPEGCNCSSCADTVAIKYKIDSAKTSEGWNWTSGQTTCSMTACPAGYTRGVTECSTGYTYSSSGKSGGQVCGKCTTKIKTCRDYNANLLEINECSDGGCTPVYPEGFNETTHAPIKICLMKCNAKYYKVVDASTSNPKCIKKTCEDYNSSFSSQQNNAVCQAVYPEGTPSSSSEAISCYMCCDQGYSVKVLSSTQATCEKITCETGDYLSSIPSGKGCATVTYNGLTCYKDCSKRCENDGDCWMRKADNNYCTTPADGSTVCNGQNFATSANCSTVVNRLSNCLQTRTPDAQPNTSFCGNYFSFQSLVCDTETHRCIPEKCNWDNSGCKCSTYADFIYFKPQSGMDCTSSDPSATGGRVCYRCTKKACTSNDACRSELDQICGSLESDCLRRNGTIYGYCMGAAQTNKKPYTEAFCAQSNNAYVNACKGHASVCATCSDGKCVAKTFDIKTVVPDYSGYYDK